MKKFFPVFTALVMIVALGCTRNAGDPVTREFKIDGSYTELEVENAFDVVVSDTVSDIVITAGENIMPKIIVDKSGSKLKIRLKALTRTFGSEMKVILPYSADLVDVELSGACELRTGFPLKGQKVSVDLSASSNFYGDIEASKVELDLSGASETRGSVSATLLGVELSGASEATLMGEVTTLQVEISGASNIIKRIVGNRYALVCDECRGSISGSSEAYIHCDGSIKVDLSGDSELHYTGNAATTGSSNSGGSSIIHDVL